jgi:hypothetical protein
VLFRSQMSGNNGPGSLEKEKFWTTKQIFDYFEVEPDSSIGNSGQYLGGVLVMKKNEHLLTYMKEYTKIILSNPVLCTDYFNNQLQHQEFRENRQSPKQRQLRQLEQIKLVETLNLDEETAIRFFARRNKHLDNVENLQKEKNLLINELAMKIKAGEKVNAKSYLNKITALEKKMLNERIKFYNSLDDILNNEQLAKLIVFQSKFRKEIMRTIMKRNQFRNRNNRP